MWTVLDFNLFPHSLTERTKGGARSLSPYLDSRDKIVLFPFPWWSQEGDKIVLAPFPWWRPGGKKRHRPPSDDTIPRRVLVHGKRPLATPPTSWLLLNFLPKSIDVEAHGGISLTL